MPVPRSGQWHLEAGDAVVHRLGSDLGHGLSTHEAAARLAAHGPNRLPEQRQRAPLRLLANQFADLMVVVLIAAAIVAGVIGEPQDAVAIVAIVVLNAALGFVQEFRAERAVATLRAMAAPLARVLRDGVRRSVPAESLVEGDIVLLGAGDIVPADLRLLDVYNLRIDESALTGESVPVEKGVEALTDSATTLGDRVNLASKGTIVTWGRGVGVVVAIGAATELGRVAALLGQAEDSKTPLQRRLKVFAAQLAVVVLGICLVVFGVGLLRGEPPLLMFLTALSLAVAAMPEALPAVVTVSLALGARRMVRQHALIRRLPAVETLGSVTCICTDKTGTLTGNRMSVHEVRRPPAWTVEPLTADDPLLRAMVLNSDASRQPDGSIDGEPTELALFEGALRVDPDAHRWRTLHPRLGELPFSSERGRMTTLHRAVGQHALLLIKGAPERVLPRCRDDSDVARAPAYAAAHDMAQSGLRVIAFAQRTTPSATSPTVDETDERGFELLGLVGLLDTPRSEASPSVAECHSAGIRVVMVTGDHPQTAGAIARLVGIPVPGSDRTVTGIELDAMSDESLRTRVDEIAVLARVSPEHKLRIVRSLQSRGEIVAMTGDGVNDAPALRQAEIGVAMGRGGTDVAREAADMVLVDDNFATIVAATREGRRIYDNIRRFIRYVLTGNSAEIWVLFLAPIVGLPLPLLPIHILWVNLVTDGLPGLALALEPTEEDVMRRPPRPPDESVFAHGVWQHALWVGLLMGAVVLIAQGWALHNESTHWRSITFTVLALSQLGHALAVRSERRSLLRTGLWSNPALALVVAGTIGLQLLILFVPVLNAVFQTQPLTVAELLVAGALSTVVLVAVETEKWLLRVGRLQYRTPGKVALV